MTMSDTRKNLLSLATLASLIAAPSVGCIGDRAAERTITIHQLQSTGSYPGQFQIDTSQLPSDALRQRENRGSDGAPVSTLEIDERYPIRVVLVPVKDGR
jgi:hypothetical protein